MGNFIHLVLEDFKEGLKLALDFHLVLSIAEDFFHACIIIIVHQLAHADRLPRRLDLLLRNLGLQLLRRRVFLFLFLICSWDLVRTENLYTFKDEDLLYILQVDQCEVVQLRMTLARLKFEDLGGLLDVLLPLRFKDWHALVPHLQCQLLHQVLEVFEDHGLHDLQVQVCIDVVLALDHEKLDLDPHVDRV